MTPTRWLIVGFWAGLFLVGAFYMFQSVMTPPPPPVPEQHWFPPPLPGTGAPVASPNADVRLTHYIVHLQPGAMSFTADVVIENFGQKKATGIEVSVQPYVGNRNTNSKEPGPDEIPTQAGGDPLANVLQSVAFSDLGPGETATQSFTLPVRSDADPAQTALKPKVEFQTVNP